MSVGIGASEKLALVYDVLVSLILECTFCYQMVNSVEFRTAVCSGFGDNVRNTGKHRDTAGKHTLAHSTAVLGQRWRQHWHREGRAKT